jgi:hypothetical protein
MTEERNMDDAALAAATLTQSEIDQRVFDLYDEYCHGASTGESSSGEPPP